MPIPDYQTIMLPLLQHIENGEIYTFNDCVEAMTVHFALDEEERKSRLPSGQSTYMRNRVGWAKTYLKKAGLLESPRRGTVKITARGKGVLLEGPEGIDNELLSRFSDFLEFKVKSNEQEPVSRQAILSPSERTPDEQLSYYYKQIHSQLADEILEQVKSASPAFFEKMVVDLLVAMGYGGDLQGNAEATSYSNDGGIDGIIKEDRLGLDTIYIQAKRWEQSVQ